MNKIKLSKYLENRKCYSRLLNIGLLINFVSITVSNNPMDNSNLEHPVHKLNSELIKMLHFSS